MCITLSPFCVMLLCDFPRMKDAADAASGRASQMRGNDVGFAARDVVMPGVDAPLITVGLGHCGCDASILTMMRRRYNSGDIH